MGSQTLLIVNIPGVAQAPQTPGLERDSCSEGEQGAEALGWDSQVGKLCLPTNFSVFIKTRPSE